MTKGEMIVTVVFMIASVVLFISSIFLIIIRAIINKKFPEKYNKAGVSNALTFSVFLLLSIWFLRFAIGYADIVSYTGEATQLTPVEEILNSLFSALRTFSMEEEYAEYIINIKSLIAEIVPQTYKNFSLIQFVIIAYASVLNLIAPIVGGAIILEILASVFPKIRLRLWHWSIWRKKYYFSELNASSLALAKSIYKANKAEKPVLIFTDTYIDDEKEKEYELLLEAKQYGAICVRDDLAHVVKPLFGKREFYLMDENEFGNLQTLLGLTEENNIRFLKKANIYLFVQSDAYVQVEKQINEKLKSRTKGKVKEKNKRIVFKDGEIPTIIPVRGYRNLVQNLFVEVPLYEPLIHKKNKEKLNVTVFGNGVIGTEAFLSTYWFGQLLISKVVEGKENIEECELTINVVSKEDSDVFWSKIDYINSEIKDTVRVLNGSDEKSNSKLLEYDAEGHTNTPYCNVRYIKADVKIDGFWESTSKEAKELLDSDYFIVAIGNDADNISVSDKLRRLIGKKHLEEKHDDDVGQVVIAYAVFNSELATTLNKQRHYRCRADDKTDIYMYAFGGLDEVYSCDNVYMAKHKLLAEGTGAAYDKAKMQQKHIDENKTRSRNENKNYNHWADLARAMHIKYKVFSLGLINKSVFDYSLDNFDSREDDIKKQCKIYWQIALSQHGIIELNDKLKLTYEDVELKKHVLAWLEHRRWIAFTRTMGYQYTGEFRRNLQLNGENHKNMELKLHPCLIEAKKPILYSDNNHINESWQKMFEVLSLTNELKALNKKIENLSKEEMMSLLNKKKEHLESKSVLFSKYRNLKTDLLDRLTFEWCEEATAVSISMIKKVLKSFSEIKSDAVTKEMRGEFSDAWDGIDCYDFKTYDYYKFDYDKESVFDVQTKSN